MTTTDRIKTLCEKRGITLSRLEKELGFANATLRTTENPRSDRLAKIAEYFGVSMEYLMGLDSNVYYVDDETAKTAQAIYDSKELSLLFDAAKDAKPEDLMTTYNVLLALKRKEWDRN